MSLYRPTDVETANERFGASCGHAALAAILGRQVSDVWQAARQHFEGRGYVSAPAMENALRLLRPGNWRPAANIPSEGAGPLPVRGLALIQFKGPWMEPGLPLGAQLSRTHWIAIDTQWVYDINQDGWLVAPKWEDQTLPLLLAHHKRATGWYVRRAYEVQPVLLGAS